MRDFSKRYGFRFDKNVQIGSIDIDLRNGLWNCLCDFFWSHRRPVYNPTARPDLRGRSQPGPLFEVIERLWKDHLKLRVDDKPPRWNELLECLRSHFLNCEWHSAYDFVEFLAPHASVVSGTAEGAFTAACNHSLEAERSAYRFVGNTIAPITNDIEIAQVEAVLESPHDLVRAQIQSAVEKLSMKLQPDVRNCVKEAVCAVESAARTSLGVESGTLGELIPKLKDRFGLHGALAALLDKLWGWASDTARHGMRDSDNIGVGEARLALVICSAFANYLLGLSEPRGSGEHTTA